MLQYHSLHRDKARSVPKQVFGTHTQGYLVQHHREGRDPRQGRDVHLGRHSLSASFTMVWSRVPHASTLNILYFSVTLDTEGKVEIRDSFRPFHSNGCEHISARVVSYNTS